MTNEEMTIEEAIEYFTNRNADIESAAMDEDRYHYGKKQIEDVRMRREFEVNELAINALEEQKNITNEKIEQTSWVVGKDGAKVAFQDMPIEKAKQICEILASDMREPTEEERKSTTKYIDSISKPTGIYIPENATNGDVVKQLYPLDTEVYTNGNLIGYRTVAGFIVWYELDWWNSPFKEVQNDTN